MSTVAGEVPFGRYTPRGESHAANVIAALPLRVRRLLGFNDYLVAAADVVVTFCALVVEESDVPLLERLSGIEDTLGLRDVDVQLITRGTQFVSDADLAAWALRLRRADTTKVLNRLLGTKTYNQLKREFLHDARTVLAAVKVGAHHVRPWAIAVDDAMSTLTPSQRTAVHVPDGLVSSLFGAAANLEMFLKVSLEEKASISFPPIQEALLSEDEVEAGLIQMRSVVRSLSDESLTDLSSVIRRKLRGAHDALEFSADGVSQAANSLVELIDRFAREAFSDEQILTWLVENGISDSEHTYERNGRVTPTKRAQVLCMVWAGPPINEDPERMNFQSIAAFALLNVRGRLQQLKHADEGTPAEQRLLHEFLETIESSMLLIVRLCWATAGPDRLTALRSRLRD